jgi:hypothetical protein
MQLSACLLKKELALNYSFDGAKVELFLKEQKIFN